MKPYIVDTTLRDGEQAPGVIINSTDKMEIARLLDKLGIEEVEVGTPAMGEFEQEIIKKIATSGFNFSTICWCRALTSDIDMAAKCKTDAVSISFPVSETQLKALNKDWNWVLTELPRIVKYAQSLFARVYIGFQDASRCASNKLEELVRLSVKHNVNRIRIADTVGIMTPVSVMQLFAELTTEFADFDFEFHAHNDLGMATANAFMALKYGASGVSGTVNGMGERAGNMAIEELIMAQYIQNNGYSHYQVSCISAMCSLVASAAKQPLHKGKPICGGNAFSHETGVHVRSLLKDKLSYQPYDESVIGLKENAIVIGKHSGKAALQYFFKQKGQNPTQNQLKILHKRIHETIAMRGKVPTERFILNMYQNLLFSPQFAH